MKVADIIIIGIGCAIAKCFGLLGCVAFMCVYYFAQWCIRKYGKVTKELLNEFR